MATHIHVHLRRRVSDVKFHVKFQAQTLKGKELAFEMDVEASDAYTAGDKVKAEASKRFGEDVYYPRLTFGGSTRLPANSKSLKIAKKAGPDEEEGTTDSVTREAILSFLRSKGEAKRSDVVARFGEEGGQLLDRMSNDLEVRVAAGGLSRSNSNAKGRYSADAAYEYAPVDLGGGVWRIEESKGGRTLGFIGPRFTSKKAAEDWLKANPGDG